jgi:pimeloyl-ACP methyl ester carboxylesterase
MPFLELENADIYYADEGAGDPPIVLVHGRSASSACWDWHTARLAAHHRVIRYDSVNHGFSSNSPRDTAEPDRCDELSGVLEWLGIDRPLLVGQSMGAMTVLRWAVRHPRGCAGIVAAGMGWPIPALAARTPNPPLREGLWIEAQRFDPDWARTHQLQVDRYSRLRSTATAIEAVRHPRNMGDNIAEFSDSSFGDKLRLIDVPVRVFMGEKDFFAPSAATLAEHVADCGVTTIPHADHSAYIQAWDHLVEVILEMAAR